MTNIIVRGQTLTQDQVAALDHLKKTAQRKDFFAAFIANLYDTAFKVNVRGCVSYIAGESDERLKTAFYLMLEFSAKGIESHEVLGQDFVESLIKKYGLRE